MLADPGCVEVLHTRLDVEFTGTLTLGATSVDFDGMLARELNAWIATDIDVDRFWALVEASVARLA
ncbi:hypothetical protein LQ757_06030 [Agromyces sp. SYSU K20354]|nr:hypothetical protein [Agromyces cavernae]